MGLNVRGSPAPFYVMFLSLIDLFDPFRVVLETAKKKRNRAVSS